MKTALPTASLLAAGLLACAAALLPPPVAAAGGRGPAAGPSHLSYGAGYHARRAGARTGAVRADAATEAPTDAATDAAADAEPQPGWALATPAEREEHRARLAAARSRDECLALVAQQRERMAARARVSGRSLQTPRRDACAAMAP